MDCESNGLNVGMSLIHDPPRIIKKKTNNVPGTKFSTDFRIDINDQTIQRVLVQVYCLSYPQPINISPYACGLAKCAKKVNEYWLCELKDLLFTQVTDNDSDNSSSHSKTTNRVTDIKSWLLFQVKFPYRNHEETKEFIFGPVIIVVHSNQEPAAQATLWWYSSFPTSIYPSYEMNLTVKTADLMKAIHKYFHNFLNPNHASFILERFLRPIEHNGEISFKDFVHTTYRSGTANTVSLKSWKWLYECHQLFENPCTKAMWRLGLIVGFITKQKSEEYLRNLPSGTFLLRFSESQPGTIVVVVVKMNGDIQHWDPFTKQELESEDLKSRLLKYTPQILKKFHNKADDALNCLLQVEIHNPDKPLKNTTPSGYTRRPDAGCVDGIFPLNAQRFPDFNDDLNVGHQMEVDNY